MNLRILALKICVVFDVLLLSGALAPNALPSSILPPKSVPAVPLFANKQDSDERGGAIYPSYKKGLTTLTQSIEEQYRLRVDADPNFISKSITEVFLAAATQLTAEIGRRGANRVIIEIDFVVAGILTAIAGKYYSMWRTAPTRTAKKGSDTESGKKSSLPTNAFQTDQPYSILQRGLSFLVPIPSLFQAGFVASALGYGFTSILIFMRSTLVPSYEAATINVNILHACLYTGGFMAIVSNIRYQLLQGVIEPQIIERFFTRFPLVKAALIFAVRLANGLLGSCLAIAGMKMFGLQKVK